MNGALVVGDETWRMTHVLPPVDAVEFYLENVRRVKKRPRSTKWVKAICRLL